ncbi:uncharacterized protein [Anabrus simplex]|uniref:uncharacterized protein n=1 Tax=Anabrus simplex TaxID=316456 RepID=UPI0035A361AF
MKGYQANRKAQGIKKKAATKPTIKNARSGKHRFSLWVGIEPVTPRDTTTDLLRKNNMRGASLVMFVVLLLLALVVAAPPECIKDEKACVRSSECCGGCCQDGKCLPYADSCSKEDNPCSLHQCPEDQTCYLHQVQCVQAPCPPVPACRSSDYEDYDIS